MASNALTTSRRAVIGALALTPAIMTATEAISAPLSASDEWTAALDAFHNARDARKSYLRNFMVPAEERWQNAKAAGPEGATPTSSPHLHAAFSELVTIERRYDELVRLVESALRRLVATPAPNCRALAQKLELARDEALLDDDADEWADQFIADARRLGGEA